MAFVSGDVRRFSEQTGSGFRDYVNLSESHFCHLYNILSSTCVYFTQLEVLIMG